jgi:histidyl-tRNA synthetase
VKKLQETGKYSAVLYDLTPEPRKLRSILSEALSAGTGFLAILAEEEWNADRTIQLKNLQTKNAPPVTLKL